MATKVVNTNKEALYLVDSQTEADRSKLESTCKALIVKMLDSDSERKLILTPDVERGTSLGASSSTDISTDQGSSVDVTETDSSNDIVTMAKEVSTTKDDLLAPETLPDKLRDEIPHIVEEDLRNLYSFEAGARKLETKELTTVELIVMHLKSYRNIIKYELSDMEMLRGRFIGFFSSILADLLTEVCYPDKGSEPLVRKIK